MPTHSITTSRKFPPHCQRCGTCCLKGGPALHQADRPLIEKGILAGHQLLTIRQWEPAWDNVLERIEPAPSDIIKIQAHGSGTACLFYERSAVGCTIYADRPQECRTLQCWDTSALRACYRQNRLQRQDLLGHIEGLWDLISAHQLRCSYAQIYRLVHALAQHPQDPCKEHLLEMVRYDLSIRQQTQLRGGLAHEYMAFLFGRPLIETLRALGVKVWTEGGRWQLQVMSPHTLPFDLRP